MHKKQPIWKWLAALIGVAMVGSWCPEAFGQVEAQPAEPEKEVRPEPLKSAPLEVLSRKHIERKSELPQDLEVLSQEHVEQNSELPEDTVLVFLESMPELIGGMRSLTREIQYPWSAYKDGIQGVVYLSFVVNEQGFVEQAVVKKGIGGGCDEEALRVIRQARFKPGIQIDPAPDGNFIRKPVKVQMSLPITFKLR